MCVCLHVVMWYLGNGSGAASPCVKHHSILMSFLQHLILHKQNHNKSNHSFLRFRVQVVKKFTGQNSGFSNSFYFELVYYVYIRKRKILQKQPKIISYISAGEHALHSEVHETDSSTALTEEREVSTNKPALTSMGLPDETRLNKALPTTSPICQSNHTLHSLTIRGKMFTGPLPA